MDEDEVITTPPAGGFFGEDGFTMDDAEQSVSLLGNIFGWFGIGTPPPSDTVDYVYDDSADAAYSSGTTIPSWVYYVGGTLVLGLAAYFIVKAMKKK